ncbi:cell division protein FtsA [Hoylesella buccalis]|uniref:cell division protein FtsA n=1 Tax=Hoylesella buccalis TaxID=28127 RepID=UPI001D145679|nr:cell division protein FtsA [Hoylesella buccalis]UEA61840.1 cell division protein FtsA [Hoylesella buccalis]UWP48442.1 cell division protein FtsA [Hoylesella buccalis ATCC 35310]
MAKEFIVAIELGSSKITGIAGKKNSDGSISILAVVKEDSTSCIRKGVVFNIDKTVLCLTNIIKKLETTLKTNIARVYVGVGGQSIRSLKNVIIKDLPAETVVTQDMINELMDANRSMTYAEQEILDAATQEYKVDALYQLDPVGIPCSRLEGNFLNILWRKTFYKNLNQCLNKAGVEIAELYLAPLALADAVLTETEKRTGCALIDLGADTTTVLVYYKNILRHLAVIPLGGENITKDITSLLMEDSQAEQMKLKYASAYTDNSDIDDNKKYPIDQDRKVDSRKFIEIVESRLQEIIENVFYQIPNEYADKLIGGIILTGGGSNMPNIEKAFTNQAPTEKIRIAKFVNQNINSNLPEITTHTGTMNTILGLLAKGDINCAGEEITADLFQSNEPKHVTPTPAPAKGPRSYTETSGTGIVQTEEEKELLRKKKEEQEEAERKAQEEEERRIAKEKRENSPVNKIWKSIKNFASKITEEEE